MKFTKHHRHQHVIKRIQRTLGSHYNNGNAFPVAQCRQMGKQTLTTMALAYRHRWFHHFVSLYGEEVVCSAIGKEIFAEYQTSINKLI